MGQEFASLSVRAGFLTDTRVPRTDLEKRFPDILVKDLLQAVTEREKDRLTLGLF